MKKITTSIFIFFLTINSISQGNLTDKEIKNVLEEPVFKDEIIVINIWDPNKPKEIKKLNTLVNKYQNKKIRFIAITDYVFRHNDLKETAFKYENFTGITANKIFDKFQTGMFKVYPIHIILNDKGNVVFKKKRFIKNITKKISKKLDALLRESNQRINYGIDQNIVVTKTKN